MDIRRVQPEDFDRIWPIFREIAREGETYAYPVDINRDQACHLWMDVPRQTYVFEHDGEVLGTYYIKSNQQGPGAHVCNCGYMVSSSARGRGVASAMCAHSLQVARELGYKAMQFNFVASSNEGAINLWKKLGFAVVGRLPKAFDHPAMGYIDALIMYKWLEAL
ncbi:GNAT family N-acetyltransferase [Microbulbifer litoralis]|uniref:GNAT family N-acetyltransferase n=1 Tax=Microbulbifer litoralis TaxID=2933965 RepID=UPI002027D40B|nr:GNAT family N-acetyltransferase [Microbulbifer sp. GX H0434]